MTLPNPNATGAEQTVSRAFLDPAATPISDVYNIEELQSLELITTPKDTPLVNQLLSGAVHSGNMLFEWVETTLPATLTNGKYDGYDVSTINEGNATPATKSNHLMAVGQIARVSGLVNALNVVNGNAMLTALQQRYIQLLRMMEYYLWNGDYSDANDETDGIVELVTTAIANGGGVIQEAILQAAITGCVTDGIDPDTAYCSFLIAYAIANMAEDRIRYDSVNTATNGIGQQAFYYMSPFGYNIRIQPVRPTFIPTGTVYVMDSSLMTLRYTGDAVVTAKPLAEANDGQAILLRAWFGLELKDAASHRVITGVKEGIT